MLKARQAIRSLPAYHPPLEGRAGLCLDFNENTTGCSPLVLERLRRLSPEELVRYPERRQAERTMAGFLGVSADELLLTNGVDEAIHLLCQSYLEPGDEALIVVPTYSMYRIYMMAAGAQVRTLTASRNFQFPAEELHDSISERTKLIAIANPNNPTGNLAANDELLAIAASATSSAVLIDEAYFEFCGQTVLSYLHDRPNLFVARTFSKAYGLAGLRLGALIGNRDQMATVRLACSPYNVNAVALACLPTALGDHEYLRDYVNETLESRERFESRLQSLGIPYWPSRANFVLLRVGLIRSDAALFAERMRSRGILVRDRSTDYGCEGCVRITLGLREHTDQLLKAFQTTLDELGTGQGAIWV